MTDFELMKRMRLARLHYAVEREADRQNTKLRSELVEEMALRASNSIERKTTDEQARVALSEEAERSLNPVITRMIAARVHEHSGAKEFLEFCETASPVFPWIGRIDER